MIETLKYELSSQVLQEIEAIEATRNDLLKKVADAATLQDYCHPFLSSSSGRELLDKLTLSQPIKIIDIGFGRGETSLFFANQGHFVHAVEPSPLNCEVLQKAATKYGQNIHVYQGTAEHFDQSPEKDFDLCLFNSSLHHCDEPIKALQICKAKLKKTGKVVAINEPILKFYRSKKWFESMLKHDPVAIGHYGGNEHIYYYHEYEALFKAAGFPRVEGLLHVKSKDPRVVIGEDLNRKIEGQYVLSNSKLLLKFTILLLLKKIWSKPVVTLGKKLSLFSFTFEASMER